MKYIIDGQDDDIVKLSLQYVQDELTLVATDDDGSDFFLITIMPDGKVCTHSAVPDYLGFEVDKNGELEIYSSDAL